VSELDINDVYVYINRLAKAARERDDQIGRRAFENVLPYLEEEMERLEDEGACANCDVGNPTGLVIGGDPATAGESIYACNECVERRSQDMGTRWGQVHVKALPGSKIMVPVGLGHEVEL